jgi:hypothetical protein
LDGRNNNSYSSYQKELLKDNNLQKSDLKTFVDAMCTKDTPKYVTELPDSDKKKSLSQIQNKLQ